MRETGSDHVWATRDWRQRAFTVGIGGPVGSGKTALVLQLCRHLRDHHSIAVVTNDIFTRGDAEYLTKRDLTATRSAVLSDEQKRAAQRKFGYIAGSWCCAPNEEAKRGAPRAATFMLWH